MKKLLLLTMLLLITVTFAVACSSADKKSTGSAMKAEFEGAPGWVKGSASTSTQICGVGNAAGTRSSSMARTAAMGRGRTEIARVLELQVKSMLKDYQATTTGGENFGEAANDEQHVENVSKQITNTALSGTEQKETWISNSGTLYVLMCVDINKFKDAVNKMSQLNENVRKAIVERADKAFDELSKETDKK